MKTCARDHCGNCLTTGMLFKMPFYTKIFKTGTVIRMKLFLEIILWPAWAAGSRPAKSENNTFQMQLKTVN
jgi:hypothetical protein